MRDICFRFSQKIRYRSKYACENEGLAGTKRRVDNVGAAFCLNHAWSGAVRGQLAARRLTLLSASVVNFLSVAFSSSRVFCNTLAQSLRPSCFAHAIRLP